MSGELYNLIMHSNPKFWSEDHDYIYFPKERFLEYTDDHLKARFQSLDQSAINEIKKLPTLFATEQEMTETRIGKITKIEELQGGIRIYYKFDEEYYPLSNAALQKNRKELNIEEFEFHRGHWAIKEGNIPSFYENYLKSLTGIAHQLKNSNKKVQLIYAFNGSGKTRLSREFKELIAPKSNPSHTEGQTEPSRSKILYYNAFTEDLFYWDNDLEQDAEPKLKIQPNSFTDWILGDQGQDQNVITHFQRYANDKLTPRFKVEDKESYEGGKKVITKTFPEVTFSLERGTDEKLGNLKISKAEESNFIWSVFYTLLEQVISILKEPEASIRETNEFDQLEYVFIDDPVSSLDENHLIELAVNLAGLITRAPASLKFIITTHSPLFYNVLHNELGLNKGGKKEGCYLLERLEDGTFNLNVKYGDSNRSFSYHLYLKQALEQAISVNQIEKYHFTLLRNLYEKTASFLGYREWADLLPGAQPDDKKPYYNRIIQFTSHSTLSSEAVTEPSPQEKQTVKLLLEHLRDNYGYWKQPEEQNG